MTAPIRPNPPQGASLHAPPTWAGPGFTEFVAIVALGLITKFEVI